MQQKRTPELRGSFLLCVVIGLNHQSRYNARLRKDGPVAQSVEQRIENPCVGGSIPPQATKFSPLGFHGAFAAD